ncbi:unnamed protein product [Urochloa decumbens]|uniref:BHLH domain-containing protein n=1 Tax=Urochloa decumbens TaxID=240449 RepID=A0ABC8WCL2_9POAL
MNYPAGHAAGPLCYRRHDAGEATGDATTGIPPFAVCMDDDIFELEWDQGGGAGGAPGSSTTLQQVESGLWSLAPSEVRFDPPSEDEMAAWLLEIVKQAEEIAFDDEQKDTAAAGGRDVPAKGSSDPSTTTDKIEKLPIMEEGMGTKQQRRRHKINEKLRTLQQLVPGCDKCCLLSFLTRLIGFLGRVCDGDIFQCNQASTLDQTIKYMKSLQHQVQAMSIGPARPTMMAAAPVVLAPAPAMVPFRAMLQLPHYPAAVPVMVRPAAAAVPLYTAAAPLVAPGGTRSTACASHRRQGSSSSKGNGCTM